MKGWITINTDAGYLPKLKVGSYAYWIKGDDLFLRGSGVFKDSIRNSNEAEIKAIINAVHILSATGRTDIVKIVFNRDNINAKATVKGNDLQKILADKIKEIRNRCEYNGAGRFYEFRHVKAHRHTRTSRHWVNDWLDKECTRELKNYQTQCISNPKERTLGT